LDQVIRSDDEAASQRFIGLLDYVNALIKLDERVPLRLSQHKLPDGSSVVLYEHELSKLPGITLNKADDGGPVWLRKANRESQPGAVGYRKAITRFFRQTC
jgi:hypothetical protein